jgi:chemotaxis-related protein WspD
MSRTSTVLRVATHRSVHDCWATTGVRGDSSCPELERHVHCRNCPVYSASAMQLLDAQTTPADVSKWTAHFSERKHVSDRDTQAVVIFRLGVEWLALSASAVREVANPLPIHSLPHRRDGAVLGLANVRGELVVCISLPALLGLRPPADPHPDDRLGRHRRLLVIRHDQVRAVCPVDAVHGVHRFHPRQLREVPATVAKASSFSRALLPWQQHSVGVVDNDLLFAALKRSMA